MLLSSVPLGDCFVKETQMKSLDRADSACESIDEFYACAALAAVEQDAKILEDLNAADEEMFEDDLISLIASRPSRLQRRHAGN